MKEREERDVAQKGNARTGPSLRRVTCVRAHLRPATNNEHLTRALLSAGTCGTVTCTLLLSSHNGR